MFSLCVYLFFPSVFTYELTTKPSGSEHSDILNMPSVNLTGALKNNTEVGDDKTIVTERITQPLQSQKIERILETVTNPNASRKVEHKNSSFDHFKPSPQLETYYEFNKFPVMPALPEAKTFGSFSSPGYSLNNWDEKPVPRAPWLNNNKGVQNPWFENSKSHISWDQNVKTNSNPTTEQPWITRVKFPSQEVNEKPYQFVSNDEKLNLYHPPVNFPTTTEGFSFNKPVQIPKSNINKPHKPTAGLWQKLMGTDNNVNKNGVAAQKTFFDYNLMEKPPQYNMPVKEYDTGVSYSSQNPWAKIIKLLTAVIPIGLFISALTPTVISVTSMNDTLSRYRTDDSKHHELTDRLASSIKYAEQLKSCEDKILCELLVTASVSKNSAEHIRNLLDTFTEHEDLQDKKDDLLKVFQAVKKEDCSSVVCKSINTS